MGGGVVEGGVLGVAGGVGVGEVGRVPAAQNKPGVGGRERGCGKKIHPGRVGGGGGGWRRD
eukprot:COSAG05_NODE_22143_length_267_cov_0.482143_1_plen_60_part_10